MKEKELIKKFIIQETSKESFNTIIKEVFNNKKPKTMREVKEGFTNFSHLSGMEYVYYIQEELKNEKWELCLLIKDIIQNIFIVYILKGS